jgi:hypothetical protein
MPLRDHFRSPVNDRHAWDELHGGWPMMIVQHLFPILPPGYMAAPGVHLGRAFEIDVSAYEDDRPAGKADASDVRNGGLATATAPKPTLTLEADLDDPDEYEVRIYDAERGRRLVAAIEIVSPSNKDRPESRGAFVGKAAALLQKDVCVAIVDLVTIRQFNLYAELLELLGQTDSTLGPLPPSTYAVTLRSRKRQGKRSLLDLWHYPLTIGQPLPALPIWLSADLSISVPLETSYEETCRLLHIS